MNDLISRQAAIDAVKYGITYAKAINKTTGEVKKLFEEGNKALNEAVERLKGLPSATMYGYNIDHLLFIASALKEKNIPPGSVDEMLKDVGRIMELIINNLNNFIGRTIEEQLSLPKPPKDCNSRSDKSILADIKSGKGLSPINTQSNY